MEVLFTSKPKNNFLSNNHGIGSSIWSNLMKTRKISWKKHWWCLYWNTSSEYLLEARPNQIRTIWNIPPFGSTIRDRKLRFADHCFRGTKEVARTDPLSQPNWSYGMRTPDRPCKIFVDQLAEDQLDVKQKIYKHKWMIGKAGKKDHDIPSLCDSVK